jgi:hypothetical protein
VPDGKIFDREKGKNYMIPIATSLCKMKMPGAFSLKLP